MVDSAGVGQFKEGMSFIDLLQIRLQEPSCHNTSKHGETDFGRGIAGTKGVIKDLVGSRMVADLRMPSLRVDPHAHDPRRRKFQHVLDRGSLARRQSRNSSQSGFAGNGGLQRVYYRAYA